MRIVFRDTILLQVPWNIKRCIFIFLYLPCALRYFVNKMLIPLYVNAGFCSSEIIVLILDGNSKHVKHFGIKIGFFRGEKKTPIRQFATSKQMP